MVKPEFFGSDSLAECSIPARLTFIGLLVCADDNGNLKLSQRRLCHFIYSCGEFTEEQFVGQLRELEEVDCIRLYKRGAEVYVNIPNFNVYQTINRPSKSTIPKATCTARTHVLSNYLDTTHGALTEDSRQTHSK